MDREGVSFVSVPTQPERLRGLVRSRSGFPCYGTIIAQVSPNVKSFQNKCKKFSALVNSAKTGSYFL